jgi:catechol 2,3-dioxygenase
MASTVSPRRPTPAQSTASDSLTYGPVHLNVTDLGRSLRFWRDLIGLGVLGEQGGATRLGVQDAELVVLHPGAIARRPRGHSGLYHLAIHLPSEAEFARVLAHLLERRYPNSPTDHVTHWATYLEDPDGIMLELSFETLDRFGRYELGGARPGIVDRDGRLREITAPLDLEQVFSHLLERELDRPLAGESRIGHIHLHVAELPEAVRFYEAVGFQHNLTLPIGMADMHAGGAFPHRLALNVWQGIGATPQPEGTAGMRHAVVRLPSDAQLRSAGERLRARGDEVQELGASLLVRDPSGNLLALISPGGQS